jgi:hypothetical protein
MDALSSLLSRSAMLRVPQPSVQFQFAGLDEGMRYKRLKFFDLSTQGGGG